MSDFDDEPITRPNSAYNEIPDFCQVYLVDEGLKKNPHCREDFYRQFSVTPGRQTPESQRTPWWPTPDPVEYREATDGAKAAKKSLSRFYAGRLLLREDPCEYMICGCDPAHWRSKAGEWSNEVQKLEEQYEKRRAQEFGGEAKEGYAEALLLSPIQSSPVTHSTFPSPAPNSKQKDPLTSKAPLNFTAEQSQQLSKKRRRPQQPTPEKSSDSIPKVSMSRKRSHGGSRTEDEDQSSLDQTRSKKRQRRAQPTPTQRPKSDPLARSARQPRTKIWKTSKAWANKASQRKNRSSLTSQGSGGLPWNLRSRAAVSY